MKRYIRLVFGINSNCNNNINIITLNVYNSITPLDSDIEPS